MLRNYKRKLGHIGAKVRLSREVSVGIMGLITVLESI